MVTSVMLAKARRRIEAVLNIGNGMQNTINSTPNRRCKRKNRTRKQLIGAVIKLLLDKGYVKVVTDKITLSSKKSNPANSA